MLISAVCFNGGPGAFMLGAKDTPAVLFSEFFFCSGIEWIETALFIGVPGHSVALICLLPEATVTLFTLALFQVNGGY